MRNRKPINRSLFLVVGSVVIGTATAAILFGITWWQERPLGTVEQILEQGEPGEALQLANEFLRRHPQHHQALALKARALVDLGRASRAIDIFRRVGTANRKEVHALAKALLQEHQWSQALPLLEYLLEADPDNSDFLHEITACRSYVGEFQAALESAQRLAATPGFEARGYLLLGTVHYNLGNKRSAAEAWKHVLIHAPSVEGLQVPAHEFLIQYGSVQFSNGHPAEALKVLERSLMLAPTAQAYALAGNCHLQLGQTEQAIETWTRATEIAPSDLIACEGLARLALERGEPEKTIQWLEPTTSDPNFRSSTAYLLERASGLLGHSEEAAKWQKRKEELREKEELDHLIDQFLSQSPHSFWAQVIRAHRFAAEGNLQQAELMVMRLKKKAPEEPFLKDLAEAIHEGKPLPSLQRIPTYHKF